MPHSTILHFFGRGEGGDLASSSIGKTRSQQRYPEYGLLTETLSDPDFFPAGCLLSGDISHELGLLEVMKPTEERSRSRSVIMDQVEGAL